MDDTKLLKALERHWETSGKDENAAHEIYHDDAVLEFPQSGERFEGVASFKAWRSQYPADLKFHTRKITHRDDFVVAENLISYNVVATPVFTPIRTCNVSEIPAVFHRWLSGPIASCISKAMRTACRDSQPSRALFIHAPKGSPEGATHFAFDPTRRMLSHCVPRATVPRARGEIRRAEVGRPIRSVRHL